MSLRQIIEEKMASAHRGDLPRRYWYPLSVASYGPDEVLAVLDVLCEFRTTMGRETADFEYAFSEWVGSNHAVMVNSGSSADLLVAFAEHETAGRWTVGVPAVTWPTHIWSYLMAGSQVRLLDVDPATLNVAPDEVDKVADEIDILSVVHLMGNPCDMKAIEPICRANDLILYEDCCEALGAEVGYHGTAATWSFFFSHQMTTLEGGMITTDDPQLAEQYRVLRDHGWTRNMRRPPVLPKGLDPRYAFIDWGFNVRPTELAAAFGLVQLRRLEDMNRRRMRNYERFADQLHGVPGVRLPTVSGVASPFAVPMMARKRDQICHHLETCGVETRRIVVGNIARHPAALRHQLTRGALPGADEVHDHGFVIGLHPLDEDGEIDKVAALVREAAG
jgi:CDP-6-deoxy-D-xylo-4-hexulose-3-dehydrase